MKYNYQIQVSNEFSYWYFQCKTNCIYLQGSNKRKKTDFEEKVIFKKGKAFVEIPKRIREFYSITKETRISEKTNGLYIIHAECNSKEIPKSYRSVCRASSKFLEQVKNSSREKEIISTKIYDSKISCSEINRRLSHWDGIKKYTCVFGQNPYLIIENSKNTSKTLPLQTLKEEFGLKFSKYFDETLCFTENKKRNCLYIPMFIRNAFGCTNHKQVCLVSVTFVDFNTILIKPTKRQTKDDRNNLIENCRNEALFYLDKKGYHTKEISKVLKVRESKVQEILSKSQTRQPKNTSFKKIEKQIILRLYEKNVPTDVIAYTLNLSPQTIYKSILNAIQAGEVKKRRNEKDNIPSGQFNEILTAFNEVTDTFQMFMNSNNF